MANYKTVAITINTENAAFEEDPGAEVARILRVLANSLERGDEPSSVYDFNGNIVGRVGLHT
jgi:hypothetical protein